MNGLDKRSTTTMMAAVVVTLVVFHMASWKARLMKHNPFWTLICDLGRSKFEDGSTSQCQRQSKLEGTLMQLQRCAVVCVVHGYETKMHIMLLVSKIGSLPAQL
jgi:hypothetical protein